MAVASPCLSFPSHLPAVSSLASAAAPRAGDHHGQAGQFGTTKAILHRSRTRTLAFPSRENVGLSRGRISTARCAVTRESRRWLRRRPAYPSLPVRPEGGGTRPYRIRFDRGTRPSLQNKLDRHGDLPGGPEHALRDAAREYALRRISLPIQPHIFGHAACRIV